jgi:hypothetical protein
MADGAQHQRTEFDGADITKVIAERRRQGPRYSAGDLRGGGVIERKSRTQ